MIKITVPVSSSARALEIVAELRALGLQQGTDFDFRYEQGFWDHTGQVSASCEFLFKSENNATMFSLKYL